MLDAKLLGFELPARLLNLDLFSCCGLAKHSTPEECGKFVQSEMSRWRALLPKKP